MKNTIKIPKVIKPGLIDATFQSLQSTQDACTKTYVGSMDAKKTAMGLRDKGGDVDMIGFEGRPTLADRLHRVF